MKFWWMRDFRRLAAEKSEVETLATQGWFTLGQWRVHDFKLAVEGDICVDSRKYPIRLIYGDQFPQVPAWVEPFDSSQRWSGHQFGAGGPLCLEWRSDNWTPSVTGADVLRSAYELLRREDPLGPTHEAVESAHDVGTVQTYVRGREPVLGGTGCLLRVLLDQSHNLRAIRWSSDGHVWPILLSDDGDDGFHYRPPGPDVNAGRIEVPVLVTRQVLPDPLPKDRASLLTALGVERDPTDGSGPLLFLVVQETAIVPIHSTEDGKVYRRKLTPISDNSGLRSGRAPGIEARRVAVVGCGSVGSKVAEILTRSGVRNVVLVDGDIFLPENLERHILDWRDVGFEKTSGVRKRLLNIAPATDVTLISTNLDWQRSARIAAQHGFDYQIWNGIGLVPGWLRLQSFEGITFEGLEDFEARFFAPHSPDGHVLDRFQAKSGVLGKPNLVKVLKSFAAFDRAHSKVARVHTVLTQQLPPGLGWLSSDHQRVRNARPFYAPFPQILSDSEDRLKVDFLKEFGRDLGEFAIRRTEICLSVMPDRSTAEIAFSKAMLEAFPSTHAVCAKMGTAFSALCELEQRRRGAMITRAEIVTTIEGSLGTSLALPAHLQLHMRSDNNSPESGAIEIDGWAFRGGGAGVPPVRQWELELKYPLAAAATWAHKNGHRRVAISGNYRLSPGFTLGWAFRSAIGFELEIPVKEGTWHTDDHPPTGCRALPCTRKTASALRSGRLAVAVGVGRDPTPATCSYLALPDSDQLLHIQGPPAITTATELQMLVSETKHVVCAEVARLGAKAIDLFIVGPAAFAVALGHRWNAMAPTQLHEYDPALNQYAPSVRV